jgi:hypothetical protein
MLRGGDRLRLRFASLQAIWVRFETPDSAAGFCAMQKGLLWGVSVDRLSNKKGGAFERLSPKKRMDFEFKKSKKECTLPYLIQFGFNRRKANSCCELGRI